MRQALTRTMAIEAPAPRVLAYMARPENLPEWCRAMLRPFQGGDDAESVESPGGQGPASADRSPRGFWANVDPGRGVVDYFFRNGAGLETASARVIPVDGGSQVVLTVFEPSQECRECGTLEERAAAVEAELAILKAFLESAERIPGPEIWN